jgi:competence protein ComEC
MNLLSAPRQPFVGLALAAATGIVVADFWSFSSLVLLLLFVFCGMLLWIWSRSILVYALVAIGFFWIHSFHLNDSSGSRLAARLGNEGQAITASGSVVGEPKIRPNGFASFLFKLSAIELDGKTEPANATVFVRWRGQPKFGDELKLFGVLEPIQSPRNPGEFDWRTYLARLDVRRNLSVRYEEHGTIVRRGGGNVILRLAQKSRAWMQDALSLGLRDDRTAESVISGLSLGIVQETPDDIEEPFQQTGTYHLFAVSGLNVAIVARLLWVLGILIRIPRRWTIALIIPALGFYAAITGLQTSSVRAAVMTSVLLLGFFAERKVLTLNSLAAAAFVILGWSTNELFSVGFQLSFAVVLAILLLAEPIFRLLRRWSAPDPFLPSSLLKGPRRLLDAGFEWLCRGAAVSLAAWLGSTSLILWNFHLVTPISLFANLVVVPIAFFVLAIAMISLLSAPLLPWLAIIFNHANWLLAHLLLWTVNLFAQVPGGHFYLELPPWSHAQTEMTVLDVGAGAAVHLRAPGSDWLFDCGSERDYEWLLRQYLRTRGVNRLDGLLLTHGDSLHIGAAGEVVKAFWPRNVVDNPLLDRSTVHRRLRAVFDRLGVRLRKPLAGETLKISHDVTAKILFPPGNYSAPQADDEAIVLQFLLFSSTRVLLVSDSGYETERYLCEAGLDLRSDILIKGQHHSGESGSDAFLDAVQPRLIIATSRDFPAHQRVDDEWAGRVRAKGIKLFRQDETGAVQLHFAPGNWEARSYVTGETFRSSSR